MEVKEDDKAGVRDESEKDRKIDIVARVCKNNLSVKNIFPLFLLPSTYFSVSYYTILWMEQREDIFAILVRNRIKKKKRKSMIKKSCPLPVLPSAGTFWSCRTRRAAGGATCCVGPSGACDWSNAGKGTHAAGWTSWTASSSLQTGGWRVLQ